MKKNKTIAIFSAYSVPHLGGIERYTENLSKRLVKLGYKIIIVSSNYDFSEKYYFENDGIINYKLPVRNMFVGRYPIPKKNKEYKSIMNELTKYNIDAIIVNTRFHLTSLVGSRFGRKNNIPVFLIEHGSEHLSIDNKILDFFGAIYEHALTCIIKKNVNYYYGVSEEACKWQKHFRINSDGVWYNSINEISKNYKIEKDTKNIKFLYAGRILKQKGLIELVNAFVKLSNKYSNIELNIAGDGNLLPSLKEKYNYNNIHYLGKLDFDKLCKEYSKTHIFVYAPNWPEGLPTGILEAGMFECSVISSPQGGNKEIILDNKTGLMTNNEEELYAAMEKLLIDKKLRDKLGHNLKKRIQELFIWDNTAKKIIDDIKKKLSWDD